MLRFSLESLGSQAVVLPAGLKAFERVHVWQAAIGVKSQCGVHDKGFPKRAAGIGISADKNRACKVLGYGGDFRTFVANRVPQPYGTVGCGCDSSRQVSTEPCKMELRMRWRIRDSGPRHTVNIPALPSGSSPSGVRRE
jgi:hypothetical protein